MNYISFDITVAAAITSVLLCVYTYIKDRVEKEPIGFLVLLFGVGGVLSVPTVYSEMLVSNVFEKLFDDCYTVPLNGIPEFTSDGMKYMFYACISFVSVALIEVAVKWLAMFLITFKSKHFNSLFDGIIYGAFVSLGFAMVDNIRFAWMNGWDMLLLRSLTTIPVHMFIGVFMGYYYTLWHKFSLAAKAEKQLADKGAIVIKKPFLSMPSLALSFFIPFMIQGLYTFTEYTYMMYSEISLYIVLMGLFVLAFTRIYKTSKDDALDNKVVAGMLLKKYPDYKNSDSDIL